MYAGRPKGFYPASQLLFDHVGLLDGSTSFEDAAMYSGLRVLVVDDVPDIADTLVVLLTLLGCECRSVCDPTEAIPIARSFLPDLFLIDFSMPRMSGPELARQLRAIPEFNDSILVSHTAYGDTAHREAAMASGFDAYLVKPVDATEWTRILALKPSRELADVPSLVAH